MSHVNLKRVSPSGVGAYASCPLKLVLDSEDGERSNAWASQKDFGTVCHWHTFKALGCGHMADPPTQAQYNSAAAGTWIPPPSPAQIALAKTTGKSATYYAFMDHVEACAKLAADTITKLTPLPEGMTWVAERKVSDPTLLPNLVNKNGDKGYGGSIDLLRSDNDILWDLKFVNPDKKYFPKKGSMLKTEYVWQLGSYTMLKKVKRSGLVYVGRDGLAVVATVIDWTGRKGVQYLEKMRRFIEFTGHANFSSIAWPIVGSQCTFCDHKETKCPAYNVGILEDPDKLVETMLPPCTLADSGLGALFGRVWAGSDGPKVATGPTIVPPALPPPPPLPPPKPPPLPPPLPPPKPAFSLDGPPAKPNYQDVYF